VILGIFVLLGGVWVVSIQSGGGGIDVGTWNEGEDFSCQDSILLPDSEDQEAAAMSMAKPTSNHRPVEPLTIEHGTLSESSIPIKAMSSQSADLELNDPAQDSSPASIPTTEIHRPRAPQLSSSSPEVPPQRSSARRVLARQSSTSMQSGNSRTVSQPHPQTTHLPPLGSVSTLGTGFQIGLSPSSPGFTILPLDRRRRTSVLGTTGPSLTDVANDIIIGLRASERRRRASEDSSLTRTLLNEVQDVSRVDGAGVIEDHTERIGDSGINQTNEARKRWRWIGKVFTGKD